MKSQVYSDKVVGKKHQARRNSLKSQASTDEDGLATNKGTLNSFPLYFTAKAWFGTVKFKAFVNGALDTQIAGLKREGVVSVSDTDFGFYGD